MSSESKIATGKYVTRLKNSDGSFGRITSIMGDYINISFPGRKPNKIRKKDFAQFYRVAEPPEGYVHPVMSEKSTNKAKPKKRRTRARAVVEDDSDIQVGVIIRAPVQKWGLGVITRITNDSARVVFMDHYTKTIPIEVIAQYFIPIELSRFVPAAMGLVNVVIAMSLVL